MRRICYRTIRGNKVKILGKILRCKKLTKGELDGKRFAFVVYLDEHWDKRGLACLWGTERLAKTRENRISADEFEKLFWEDDKLLAPNGYFNWYWWEALQALKEK